MRSLRGPGRRGWPGLWDCLWPLGAHNPVAQKTNTAFVVSVPTPKFFFVVFSPRLAGRGGPLSKHQFNLRGGGKETKNLRNGLGVRNISAPHAMENQGMHPFDLAQRGLRQDPGQR